MAVPIFKVRDVVRKHRVVVLSSNYTLYGDMSRRMMTVIGQFRTHSQCLHFRYLRDYFTASGFAVYGFDLRGYGKSGGRRVYVSEWRDFREDLRLFVKMIECDG